MPNDTSCMNLNDELWLFRGDYTTRTPVVVLFGFLYSIIIICGVIGNTCVVLAITRNKALQTVPNLFILSLSCSDIVVCCISATITPITAFRKDWIFGPALCRIAPFFAGLSLCFSTFTLTAISIDRYMLICFPMKKPLSHKQAGYVIAFICLFCGSIVSPVIFKQKLDTFGKFCGLYCTENWEGNEYQRRIYGSILLFIQFLIPLIIIGLSYTLISLRIGQSMILKNAKNKKNNSNSSDGCENYLTDQQKIAIRRKQRANRMFIAMVIAFVVSWLPSLTYNLLRDYELLPDSVTSQEFLVGVATHCTAMTSTVWNPLLYAALNPQLRAAFIELIPGSVRQKLHLEQEKSCPLLNGNNLTGTELTQAGRTNKYGSTSIQMFKSMRVDVNTEGVTTCLVPPATPNSIYLTANSNHSQSTFCHVPKIRELSGCNENEALSESDSEGEILEPKRAMSTGTIGSRGSSRKLSAVRAFLHSPTHQAEDKRQLIEESPEEPEPPQAKLSLSFGNVTKKLLELSDSIPRRRSAQENDVQRLLPNGTASIVRTTSF